MVYKTLGLWVILLLVTTSALMQETQGGVSVQKLDPGMLFYQEGTLYNATANGLVTVMDLTPIRMFLEMMGNAQAGEFTLSPDGTKIIFAITDVNNRPETYYVFDFAAPGCCSMLTGPANTKPLEGGVLSPDGTQFAVIFYEPYPSTTLPTLTVFDMASYDSVDEINFEQFGLAFEQGVQSMYLVGWAEGGLIAQVTLVGADEPRSYYWLPETNDIAELPAAYKAFFRLLVTGEGIGTAVDAALPAPLDESYGSNVVMYLPPSSDSIDPRLVYFNPDNVNVSLAFWAADGQAVVVQQADATTAGVESDEAYVLWRDGTTTRFSFPTAQFMVATTSDGWMTQDLDTGFYAYYRLNGTEIENIPLEIVPVPLKAIVKHPLGVSLHDVPAFPAVTAP